ncbi:MAG TPA: aminoacetone oxidase family FAD-binding enzyme, partial [Candidatus Polarisedimenticolia bacterium]|nr:aminoacetone oxidase family FAD-binding enzyme [Candidatus Polarisedimenticolia bacterium]
LIDSARRPGAKILVSGGGRCTVTHDEVDETSFSGSTPGSIRQVLRRFDVPHTVDFFRGLGVELKREETGKLFPVTDSARTVLHALIGAVREAGVAWLNPFRVERIERLEDRFMLHPTPGAPGPAEAIAARRVILATGGRSLPKSGSDGHGYAMARSLGHTITPRILPALVPLTLAEGSFPRDLPGVSLTVRLEVRSGTGRRIATMAGPLLCTHFGVSGPIVMDISRHYLTAILDDPRASLHASWLAGAGFETTEAIHAALVGLGARSVRGWLQERVPERLAAALCREADVDPSLRGHRLTRESRRRLAHTLAGQRLNVSGSRGWSHAEATAGGVPLAEIDPATMRSRFCEGLWICGEICDVDGRIGGYNFQWAWASGHVAGLGAAG